MSETFTFQDVQKPRVELMEQLIRCVHLSLQNKRIAKIKRKCLFCLSLIRKATSETVKSCLPLSLECPQQFNLPLCFKPAFKPHHDLRVDYKCKIALPLAPYSNVTPYTRTRRMQGQGRNVGLGEVLGRGRIALRNHQINGQGFYCSCECELIFSRRLIYLAKICCYKILSTVLNCSQPGAAGLLSSAPTSQIKHFPLWTVRSVC